MPSLGKDLAYIRKEKELSLEDIHESTRIPTRILQSIEDDTIFENFEEESTYIRSYVRSYAKALSIDEKQIIYALDKVEKNDYSGSLQSFLSEKPKPLFEYDDEDDSKSDDAEESSEPSDDMVHDHSPEFRSQSKDTSGPSASPSTSSSSSPISSNEPEVRSVDWANLGRKFKPLKSVRSGTWMGIILVLVLVVSGGTFLYFYQSDSIDAETANNANITNQQNESSESISTDTLELDITPMAEQADTVNQQSSAENNELQNESLSSLPDTLNIVLYAAYDRLEPVRVFTDIMGDVNPYWIEQGDAIRFTFVNELTIRGQISNMVLLFNGHPVENLREQFYNPDTRLLEINRSFFEDNDKWLQSPPDSLSIDAPPPSTIRNRPTFN